MVRSRGFMLVLTAALGCVGLSREVRAHGIWNYRHTAGARASAARREYRAQLDERMDFVFHHLTPDELRQLREDGHFGGTDSIYERVRQLRKADLVETVTMTEDEETVRGKDRR